MSARSVRWVPQSSDAMGAPLTHGTLWPCMGKPCAHFGLGMGKPCAHFGLGMGSRVHTLALAWASRVHTLALAWASRVHILVLAWADFGLGVLILALAVQRWPPKKKKKNLLRICSNFAWMFVTSF